MKELRLPTPSPRHIMDHLNQPPHNTVAKQNRTIRKDIKDDWHEKSERPQVT